MEIPQTDSGSDIDREMVSYTPPWPYIDSNSISRGPSHGSPPRGRKPSPDAQNICEEPKRDRLDYAPFSANDNDATMESSESLFSSQGSFKSSQRSFTDEINSAQTASPAIGMSAYRYQSALENVDIQLSEPRITGSYTEKAYQGIHASESPTKHSNGVARGKRPRLLSSQESVNGEVECMDHEAQKAKNRKYAKDSRERKIQKINLLEQTTINQKFIIQIYKKVIGIYWKRLNGGAVPRWTTYTIPWHNSTEAECVECHKVECLLPVEEDNAFLEELGNDPFGQIIVKNSTVQYHEALPLSTNTTIRNSEMMKISNSGSISKCKSVSKSASGVINVCQSINYPSFSHHINGYIQNPPVKSDTRGGLQTINKNLLPFTTPSATLTDDLDETGVSYSRLDDLHTPASQAAVLSHETTDTMPHCHANSGPNDTSSASVSAEYSRTTHPINTVGAFTGQTLMPDNDSFVTTQETHILDLDAAGSVPNSQLNDPGISKFSPSLNRFGSGGNGFNTDKTEGRSFVNKPENKLFCSQAPGNVLVNEEPVNLSCVSSMENLPQEIPEAEDLQSSLETA
ncbi:hypothetical protein BsWGS_20407 [Bradybaena similaris]